MSTQYTTNKAISYPQINDPGTGWGTAQIAGVNDIDVALGSTQTMNLNGVSGTITLVSTFAGPYPANSASYVPLILSLTGAPAAAVTIIVPSTVGGQWIVRNACTGTYASVIVASGGGGSSTTIPGSQTRSIFSDGTNISFADSQTATAGSTTQVIYNNAGTLTGSANLTFDGTTLTANAGAITNALTVGTTVTAGSIVKSTSGGFTFPDNTTQTTAYSGQGTIPGVTSGLKVTASSLTVTVTANYVSLFNGTTFYTAAAPSLSIAGNTTGANGLDTGSLATNWYSVWVIYNPTTTTVAGLLSLSATSPTLPSGYTFKARVGWVRAASGSAFVSTIQIGNRAQYVGQILLMASGSAGNPSGPTWSAVGISTYTPTTAATITGSLYNASGLTTIAAPDSAYSSAVPIESSIANPGTFYTPFEFVLESSNIYWASNGGAIYVSGWTDNL